MPGTPLAFHGQDRVEYAALPARTPQECRAQKLLVIGRTGPRNNPFGLHHLFAGTVRESEADLVRDELRGDAMERLVSQYSMRVIDRTNFPTLGGKSEGIQVHYCRTSS